MATSSDGANFVTEDGEHFALRSANNFEMADGSVGRLGGTVVYVKDHEGQEKPVFWLESDS